MSKDKAVVMVRPSAKAGKDYRASLRGILTLASEKDRDRFDPFWSHMLTQFARATKALYQSG